MNLKKLGLVVLLLVASSSSFAWNCPPGYIRTGVEGAFQCTLPGQSQPPTGTTNTNTNTNSNTNNLHQNQHQGQSQSSSNTNTSSAHAAGGAAAVRDSGNSRSNSKSSANNSGGNNQVGVDTSDRSTSINNSRSNVFIPGELPSNALTIAPSSNIMLAADNECGVLQQKVEIPVYQWNKRGTKKVQVGVDEDLAPVFINGVQTDYQRVDTGNGQYYLRGSHITYAFNTQGSSSSSQLGLQGGGGAGYGGVSYGSGRAYSQAGVKLIIRSCVAFKSTPPDVMATRSAYHPAVRHHRRPCIKK